MLDILILIIALAGLWIGAELIIKGSLAIARHFKLSELFVGLTIVSVGTNLPELFVDITAALHRLQGVETSGLVIGQTIGSSLAQIGLTLGIVGLIACVSITKREILRDGMMMIGAVLILFLFGIDGEISRVDGVLMIMIYILYLLSIFREEDIITKIKRAPSLDVLWAALSFAGGLAVLLIASNLTIDKALVISEHFGIAQSLIGILVVGLGTSLPELATAVTAVRKHSGKLAIGNLIGSNTFDLLMALGIGSAISGFLVSINLLKFDIPILFVVSCVAIFLLATRRRLHRREAYILLGMYGVYFLIKFLGGVVG